MSRLGRRERGGRAERRLVLLAPAGPSPPAGRHAAMSRVYHGLSSVAPVRSLFVIARRAPAVRPAARGADVGVAQSVACVPLDRGCARTPMPRAMLRRRIGARARQSRRRPVPGGIVPGRSSAPGGLAMSLASLR